MKIVASPQNKSELFNINQWCQIIAPQSKGHEFIKLMFYLDGGHFPKERFQIFIMNLWYGAMFSVESNC